jgi:hypothetical protein
MIFSKKDIRSFVITLTIFIGALLQAGGSSYPHFKSLLPGRFPMKFNTAICFILCGFTLPLLNPSKAKSRAKNELSTSSYD